MLICTQNQAKIKQFQCLKLVQFLTRRGEDVPEAPDLVNNNNVNVAIANEWRNGDPRQRQPRESE